MVGLEVVYLVWHAASCTSCGRCDESCPLGLAPSRGEADSPYCWNCGLCSDHCPHDVLGFTWRNPT
ncbi:MAG: 4Fe-4S binding protein [Desulfobulbus sp.]